MLEYVLIVHKLLLLFHLTGSESKPQTIKWVWRPVKIFRALIRAQLSLLPLSINPAYAPVPIVSSRYRHHFANTPSSIRELLSS